MTTKTTPQSGAAATLLGNWQACLFLLFTYMQMILAIPVANDLMTLSSNGSATSSPLAAQSVVIAIIMILTGLLFCFFGYRWFRVALWLAGFYLFGKIPSLCRLVYFES